MPDGDSSTPAPAARLYGGGERGAGGKLRRERKPPPTPYDRPNRRDAENGGGGGGWISRIVTPAKRLISGGATRLLPSLFSPLPPPSDSPTPDEGQRKGEQEARNCDDSGSVDLVAKIKLMEDVGPSESKGKSILNISDGDALDKTEHSDELPSIEQLIKGKTFSREEINRLMEILRTRVADAGQESEPSSKPGQEDTEKAETSYGKQKFPTYAEELEKFKPASSTPFPRPTVQNEIGASPVDIARAYMGSRTPEVGFTSRSLVSSENFSLGNELSSTTFMPSPLPKAPICWPGAVTQDQQNYATPQSQKSRYGLHNFPRTPYSRTIHTRSKSKLTPILGDSERSASVSSTPFRPMRTPLYGKSLTNAGEGVYGSGGPMCRMRHNADSPIPARGSASLRSVQPSLANRESNADFMFRKSFEPGTSSANKFEPLNSKAQNSDSCAPSVHPHSSKLARQILEQLDRPVTLKEKSEELKLVASWKSSSQGASATTHNNGSVFLTGSSKVSPDTNGQNNVLLQDRGSIRVAGKGMASASITSLDKSAFVSNIGPSSSTQKLDSERVTSDQATTDNQPRRNGQSWLINDQSKQPNFNSNSSTSEPQHAQRKPALPSISIDKSGIRASFTSENSTGFTFPFIKPSGMNSEPPTPSIIPSSSTSPDQPKVSTLFPTSTSTNKITIAPPVNAFSSPSTSPSQNDTSSPKFTFSTGKNRLSFAIEGEDADSVSNNSSVPKYTFGSGQNRLNFGSIGNDAVCC